MIIFMDPQETVLCFLHGNFLQFLNMTDKMSSCSRNLQRSDASGTQIVGLSSAICSEWIIPSLHAAMDSADAVSAKWPNHIPVRLMQYGTPKSLYPNSAVPRNLQNLCPLACDLGSAWKGSS